MSFVDLIEKTKDCTFVHTVMVSHYKESPVGQSVLWIIVDPSLIHSGNTLTVGSLRVTKSGTFILCQS